MIEIFITTITSSQALVVTKTIQALIILLETTLLVVDKRLTRMKQQNTKTIELRKIKDAKLYVDCDRYLQACSSLSDSIDEEDF